ncbi:MAG: FeoB-associated Cys-rich membrane protein [Spirochaetales bacterium]|nr:FeoB-associated Cys-rich membrane protein [Spirochaetales bacterium]
MADILVILIMVAVVLIAFSIAISRRRRGKSSCCGSCSDCSFNCHEGHR